MARDLFDVALLDDELASEVALLTELMVAAMEAPGERISPGVVDRVLGLGPEA